MQKTTVILVDDLDGSPAHETVEFAVDGRHYEIDLSEDNAALLRSGLEQYIAKARRGGTRGPSADAKRTRRPAPWRFQVSGEEAREIREWAAREGHRVAPRGRIADAVVESFRRSLYTAT